MVIKMTILMIIITMMITIIVSSTTSRHNIIPSNDNETHWSAAPVAAMVECVIFVNLMQATTWLACM